VSAIDAQSNSAPDTYRNAAIHGGVARIRYDKTVFKCAQKLTENQLSLQHVAREKKNKKDKKTKR